MSKRITAIKVQKRNAQRVNIYLNDEYAFGLARILAAWLKVGDELSDVKITELQQKDEREVVYLKALGYLNRRPHSSVELQRKLSRAGFQETAIEETIERLRQNGLVDDQAFAKTWVESRIIFHPRSRRALSFELKQKGISQEEISQAIGDDIDDEVIAYQLATRQALKYHQLEWIDFRQKMTGFLGRRGFSYGVIAPVVHRVWKEHHATVQDK